MGRRVRKEVFTYDNGWPANPDKREHFVYDGWTLDTPRLAGRDGLHGSPGALPIAASQGWNVVMVLDGLNSNAVVRKLTWGLDLSGSIHGAGGIGGLLAVEEETQGTYQGTYWFLYDAVGRRVESKEYLDAETEQVLNPPRVTHHIVFGPMTIEEYTITAGPTATLAREFVWGTEFPMPIAMIDRTGSQQVVLHYLRDVLGSVVALTDAGGNVVERYRYDPYGTTHAFDAGGTLLPSSAYGNPFAFTGQRYDAAIGLYHFWFRAYSPMLGRWHQRDPLGYAYPEGANLYEYVRSSPTFFVDILGLEECPLTPAQLDKVLQSQIAAGKNVLGSTATGPQWQILGSEIATGTGETPGASWLLKIKDLKTGETGLLPVNNADEMYKIVNGMNTVERLLPASRWARAMGWARWAARGVGRAAVRVFERTQWLQFEIMDLLTPRIIWEIHFPEMRENPNAPLIADSVQGSYGDEPGDTAM